jgi:hypothetical protein
MLWIAHIEDGDAVAEAVTDIGVSAVYHDLHAVAPAALIAMADKFDIPGSNSVHKKRSRTSLTSKLQTPSAR